LGLQLAPGGHVHQRSDQPHRRALRVAQDQPALENMSVGAVACRKRYSSCQVSSELVKAERSFPGPGQIFRVNAIEPETDFLVRGAPWITEQAVETARPKERAAGYIPIPNRIVRRPGNNLKIFRARCWMSIKARAVLFSAALSSSVVFWGRS
jgi:hypothetical protein